MESLCFVCPVYFALHCVSSAPLKEPPLRLQPLQPAPPLQPPPPAAAPGTCSPCEAPAAAPLQACSQHKTPGCQQAQKLCGSACSTRTQPTLHQLHAPRRQLVEPRQVVLASCQRRFYGLLRPLRLQPRHQRLVQLRFARLVAACSEQRWLGTSTSHLHSVRRHCLLGRGCRLGGAWRTGRSLRRRPLRRQSVGPGGGVCLKVRPGEGPRAPHSPPLRLATGERCRGAGGHGARLSE